jgi:hypothetical protein
MSEKSDQIVPFLVLGHTRRSRVATRLSSCFSSWLRDWKATPGANCEITITRCSELDPPTSSSEERRVVRVAAQGETVFEICVSEGCLADSLGLPRHVSLFDVHTGRVAKQVAEEVLRSLAQRLADVAGTRDVSVDIVVPVDGAIDVPMSRIHWFSANVAFESQRESLQLLLSPKYIAAVAPSTTPMGGDALDRRAVAVAEESMTLEAVLGEVSLTVGELASLNVNDVIVLSDGPAQPGYLATSAGARVTSVSLGRVGRSRAVAITNR